LTEESRYACSHSLENPNGCAMREAHPFEINGTLTAVRHRLQQCESSAARYASKHSTSSVAMRIKSGSDRCLLERTVLNDLNVQLSYWFAVYVANRNKPVILSRPSRSIETGWLLHFCSINKDAKPGINAIGANLCIFNRIPAFSASSLLRSFKSRSSSGLRRNQYDFGPCFRTYSPIYHFREVAGTRCTKTLTA